MKGSPSIYENSIYWPDLYKEYGGSLKASGHPSLSEALNELKYLSESLTFLKILEGVQRKFVEKGIKDPVILDVGAGFGYWTNLAHRHFTNHGFGVELTALDISTEALEILHRDMPSVRLVNSDLKSIDREVFSRRFDLVFSCYCLHHLVHVEDFINGLLFAGNSVKAGGFLIIMDPILTLPFSRFDVIDFPRFTGNGIPRHLYLLDDILYPKGLTRKEIIPAVSFLLNGNIESYGRVSYGIAKTAWRVLCRFLYRSESSVRALSKLLLALDEGLKTMSLAFSSSACVYKRQEPESW